MNFPGVITQGAGYWCIMKRIAQNSYVLTTVHHRGPGNVITSYAGRKSGPVKHRMRIFFGYPGAVGIYWPVRSTVVDSRYVLQGGRL